MQYRTGDPVHCTVYRPTIGLERLRRSAYRDNDSLSRIDDSDTSVFARSGEQGTSRIPSERQNNVRMNGYGAQNGTRFHIPNYALRTENSTD